MVTSAMRQAISQIRNSQFSSSLSSAQLADDGGDCGWAAALCAANWKIGHERDLLISRNDRRSAYPRTLARSTIISRRLIGARTLLVAPHEPRASVAEDVQKAQRSHS